MRDMEARLMTAFVSEEKEAVISLLDKGANPETKNEHGWPCILLATFKGWTDVIEKLLEKGANPKSKDRQMMTALMYAARDRHEDAMRILLPVSDVKERDVFGFTALMYAAMEENERIVEMLMPLSNVEEKNNDGYTARDLARQMKNVRLENLIERFERALKENKILKEETKEGVKKIKTRI